MSVRTIAVLAVLAVAAFSTGANAYQVHADLKGDNPCRFQGNGTCFDLSSVYPWPAVIEAGKYTFHFDPCKPIVNTPCDQNQPAPANTTTPRGVQPGMALCQTWHPAPYNPKIINWAQGGLLEPFATWNGVFPGEKRYGEGAVMEINFPYGAAWRNTKLLVVDTDADNATVSFQGEAPLMQYNFILQGKGVFGRINTYPCIKP